jgi:nucleotide-binding universal stress UspA family protein
MELEKEVHDGPFSANPDGDRLLAGFGSGVRRGLPDDRIVETARRENVDVIVMGTHGRRGAARLLLGSVAARVIASAPCPVLTIRNQAPPAAAAGAA